MPTAPPPPDSPHEFFLIVLPGFEDLALEEVGEWFPDLAAEKVHGGVVLRTTLARGLGFNLVLKIPTRVLLRITEFRCRDFPKLFKTVSEFNWSAFVSVGATLECRAVARGSRLKIKARLEETCVKAWATARRRAKMEEDPSNPLTLYVRLAEDTCTLSLDTSGERLHKRGVRTHVGLAPLRETIAAALVRLTARGASAPATEVVDPMAGSGTFLIEGADQFATLDRDVRSPRFVVRPLVPPPRRPSALTLIGLEKDPEVLKAARINLNHHPQARLIAGDLFEASPLSPATGPRWLFVNPPYGERLDIEGPIKPFFERLFAASESWARPDRACVVLPAAGAKGRLALPTAWRVLEKRPFVNGGIAVVAFVFGRQV